LTSGERHVGLGDPHLELHENPYKASNSMVHVKVTITFLTIWITYIFYFTDEFLYTTPCKGIW